YKSITYLHGLQFVVAAQALRLYGSSVATIRRAPSVVDVEVPSSRYSVFDTPLFTEDTVK
ncbi:hypothetical protein ACW3P8_004316, partial [Escherichia coli]